MEHNNSFSIQPITISTEELWKVVRDIGAVNECCTSLPLALTITATYLFTVNETNTPRAEIIRSALKLNDNRND